MLELGSELQHTAAAMENLLPLSAKSSPSHIALAQKTTAFPAFSELLLAQQ